MSPGAPLTLSLRNNVTRALTKAKMDTSETTVPGKTVLELVKHWNSGYSKDIPAFISVNAGVKRQISRSELYNMAKRFSARLKNHGILKGEIVCNTLPNSLERVVCEFGILFSGAVSMNGQVFRADGEDFLESVRVSKCSAVICDSSLAKGARKILLKEVPAGCENNPQSELLPHLKKIILCQRDDVNPQRDFLSSLEDKSLPQFSASVSPSDFATIMTTSGSTGYSKLVQLTHANICHFAAQVKNIEPLQEGCHFINCAPLGWAGGYPQWFLGCGVTRYFVDLYDGPVDDLPELIWRTIVEEKIEYGFLSPMYVNAILSKESLWRDVAWKPHILCLAGQPVKQSQLAIIGKLCQAVDINYGATECNLITTHRITDPSQFSDSCAGYPGYGVDIKVVDQHRNELPQGQTGEVLLRSPGLCSGYLSNDIATQKSFTEDGWFCTDDSGYVGEDGKLYLLGRQSDSIHRGAYILYPGWLEAKLKNVSKVKDVVVVPVPDTVLHNEICACVVVDGIKGVVAGFNEEVVSPTPNLDEVDNIATVLNKERIIDSCIIKSQTDKNRFVYKIQDDHLTASQQTLDNLRAQRQNTPLSVVYDTSVKQSLTGTSSSFCQTTNLISPSVDLKVLERDLREYADKLQILHKSDAMRMVPKYYVFMDKLPLTNTGKISRKEIKSLAGKVLQL